MKSYDGETLTHAIIDDLILGLSPAPVPTLLAHPVLRPDRDEVGVALELDLRTDIVVPFPQESLRAVLGRLDVLARCD